MRTDPARTSTGDLLMMSILSGIIARLAGPWLATVTVPALILAALTLGHNAWLKRDARILAQGERVCDARWEAAVRAEERRQAAESAAAAQKLLETERQVTEGLNEQVMQLAAELDRVRSTSGSDPRCLSDGVLDALRRRQQPRAAGEARRQQ